MILGIGTDICSIERLTKALERTENLRARLFHDSEIDLTLDSLAARFAAKEALAKALGDPRMLTWNEIAVVNDELGKPRFEFFGSTANNVDSFGVSTAWLSISHDAEVAIAMVVLEAN